MIEAKTLLRGTAFDPEYLPGARNAIVSCLRIQANEKVTLITDRACLEIGAWDEVEANCARILVYTAGEPLPMAQFIVDRGRALARFHRGERNDDLRAELRRLDDFAAAADATAARHAIAAALAGFETPTARGPAPAFAASGIGDGSGAAGATDAAGPATAAP